MQQSVINQAMRNALKVAGALNEGKSSTPSCLPIIRGEYLRPAIANPITITGFNSNLRSSTVGLYGMS